MLMLLAQNLLTQRLRATATFNLFFVIIITMNHIFRSLYSSQSTPGRNERSSGWDSGCFFNTPFHICASCNTHSVSASVSCTCAATRLCFSYSSSVKQRYAWEAFLLNTSDAKSKRMYVSEHIRILSEGAAVSLSVCEHACVCVCVYL